MWESSRPESSGAGGEGEAENCLYARCVLVDTEKKVVEGSINAARESGLFQYRRKNSCLKTRGSGNNWANGYINHGPTVVEEITEKVKKEVSACPTLTGIMIFLSLAGGTGSGLGSFVSQKLRESFPHVYLVHVVVWPFMKGEVSVQNYNICLTLSTLYQHSDCIVVAQNDKLQENANALFPKRRSIGGQSSSLTNLPGSGNVTFDNLNYGLALNLCNLMVPVGLSCSGVYSKVENQSKYPSFHSFFAHLVEFLCPNPLYKLTHIQSFPIIPEASISYSTFVWKSVISDMQRAYMKAKTPQRSSICAVSNVLILRGKDANDITTLNIANDFLSSIQRPSWSVDPIALWSEDKPPGKFPATRIQDSSYIDYEKNATLASNDSSVCPILQRAYTKATLMFQARAFVHQYYKYGLDEYDLAERFTVCEDIVNDYNSLLKK
eukprot:Nk52_evm115s485 gene=Nk52_evmTU115s485